jgi:hypothetical protein
MNEEDRAHEQYKQSLPDNERKALNNARNKIKKAFLNCICCCDGLMRCRSSVSVVHYNCEKPTFTEEKMQLLTMDEQSRSSDGKYYICHTCKTSIKNGKVPRNAESQMHFRLPSLQKNVRNDVFVYCDDWKIYLKK